MTATFADVSQALSRDMKLIFPVAAVLIGLILLLTLRGLPAAGMLLGSVVLGFLATLGASVLVFQGLVGKPGVEFQLPIVVYLFVTAMGTDYNILMVSRLREELAGGHMPRQAADLALRQTGPSVAAAGIILAGSFATLTLNSEIAQVGFAVAVGILLATFAMSWLLVPALIAWAGRAAFWPSREQGIRTTEALEPLNVLRISDNEWR
jgi:RND superfamily putative drug exporter